MIKYLEKTFSPIQLLSMGYVILVLIGAFLLALPFSSTSGEYQFFIDSLFTSASAVSTTGLVVVDTGTYYSQVGQIIILILIQIGGLGYMVFFVVVTYLLKEKLSVNAKKYLRESISRTLKVDMIRFVKLTFLFTFVIELSGSVGYYIIFSGRYHFSKAVFDSVFHSVSAFCTAGFGLYPDNLCSYKSNLLINLNTFFLVITGAIGFFVLYDLSGFIKNKIKKERIAKFTLHTKVVLLTTFLLFLAGALIIFFTEGDKFAGSLYQKILDAFFQSISASTTVGFNSVDISKMSAASLFIMIILMFIGASPGSTGGGIKTTSFTVFSASCISALRNIKNVVLFKRTINRSVLDKASVQVFLGGSVTLLITLLMNITDNFDFLKILFEAVSAFGTVGLSAGITSQLSAAGKLLIIFLMIFGRIGPLAVGLSFIGKNGKSNYTYPEEEIFVA